MERQSTRISICAPNERSAALTYIRKIYHERFGTVPNGSDIYTIATNGPEITGLVALDLPGTSGKTALEILYQVDRTALTIPVR